MLTFVVCDDDQIVANSLNDSLRKEFDRKGIRYKSDVFYHADDLCHALDKQYYDLIVLDIEIGDASGIVIGNKIRDVFKNQKSKIVYISSHDAYHMKRELYDSEPMISIKKPFTGDQITKIVDMVISRVIPKQLGDDDYFTFEHNKNKVSLLKSEIIYVDCERRKKVIYTSTAKEPYVVYLNLEDIIKELNSTDFIRIHRSRLINFHSIKTFNQTTVSLTTGEVLSISSKYKDEALLAMSKLR